ncbi:MAG: hypothetical protein ACI9LU_003109, partial [Polaribacter sp.]
MRDWKFLIYIAVYKHPLFVYTGSRLVKLTR